MELVERSGSQVGLDAEEGGQSQCRHCWKRLHSLRPCEVIAKHLVEGPGRCEPGGPAVHKRRPEERTGMNWILLASLHLSFLTPTVMVSEHTFLFRLTREERILGNRFQPT